MIHSNIEYLSELSHKSKTLLLLAPSSYIGKIYVPRVYNKLKDAFPEIALIAVDDVLHKSPNNHHHFDKIITTEEFKGNASFKSLPAVNCSYSISTWRTFKNFSDSNHCLTFDLTELLYLLDIALVYETPSKTKYLTTKHQSEFRKLQERLKDNLSKETLEALLRFRQDGNRAHLLNILCPGEQEYFSQYSAVDHPIQLTPNEHYVDIGAYDGDTLRKFLTATGYNFEAIHAFEPDPSNFKTMQSVLIDNPSNITLHNQAVSDTTGSITFLANGTMGSRTSSEGNIQVACIRLDDVIEKITLLKMDVEGHEANVLRGAGNLIRNNLPRMAITCYHHTLDILDIVHEIDQIAPGAVLKLRHYSMFFYDSILYVEWPQ